MQNGTPIVKNGLIQIRALIDKRTLSILERWAKSEGRSGQMHNGIILRRVAAAFEKNPERLAEIGMPAPAPFEMHAA